MNTTHTTEEPLLVPDLLAPLNLQNCYQCGKCTAGCPVAGRMDLCPNQVVALLRSGEPDRALRSDSAWLCVSCQTCSTRCPQSVDCAGAMDAVRQLSFERGVVPPGQPRTLVFQKAFLDNIRRNGRLNELELAGAFKTKAFLSDLNVPFLFKDALLAPRMKVRGKLRLFGEKAKDRAVVERIFDRCLS